MDSILGYVRGRLRAISRRVWPQIAEECGLPLGTLAKIATGERHNPTLSTIEPLYRYFRELDRGDRQLPFAPDPEERAA
jgi:transcriptional regulator with XRE-family HTH domain